MTVNDVLEILHDHADRWYSMGQKAKEAGERKSAKSYFDMRYANLAMIHVIESELQAEPRDA